MRSDCCGAAPRFYNDWDIDSTDLGFCPECKEHTTFIEEDDDDE